MPPKKPLKLKTTADLREDPKNPRAISPEALAGLKGSLSSFGDISGITLNSRTGELVSGHQRLKALTEQHGPLPIITLGAHTFIETPAGPVTIRLVDWPLTKQRAANIAANSPHIAGEFTDELQGQLAALRADDAALFEALRFGELTFEAAAPAPDGDPLNTSASAYSEQYGVIVVCENETEQEAVFNRLKEEGLNVRVVVT